MTKKNGRKSNLPLIPPRTLETLVPTIMKRSGFINVPITYLQETLSRMNYSCPHLIKKLKKRSRLFSISGKYVSLVTSDVYSPALPWRSHTALEPCDPPPVAVVIRVDEIFTAQNDLSSQRLISVEGLGDGLTLVQIASRQRVYLFDLLSMCEDEIECFKMSIGPLLSSSNKITKVVHDFQLRRSSLLDSLQIHLCDVFDIQESFAELQMMDSADSAPLQLTFIDLLARYTTDFPSEQESIFMEEIDRNPQLWNVRPMADAMIAFAARLAHLLLRTRDVLRKELQAARSLKLARSMEMTALEYLQQQQHLHGHVQQQEQHLHNHEQQQQQQQHLHGYEQQQEQHLHSHEQQQQQQHLHGYEQQQEQHLHGYEQQQEQHLHGHEQQQQQKQQKGLEQHLQGHEQQQQRLQGHEQQQQRLHCHKHQQQERKKWQGAEFAGSSRPWEGSTSAEEVVEFDTHGTLVPVGRISMQDRADRESMAVQVEEGSESLIALLPGWLGSHPSLSPSARLSELKEVVVDYGRVPFACFQNGEKEALGEEAVSMADIEDSVSKVGRFGLDNRAGVEGTLHRISALRNREDQIIGLTFRVGRAVRGCARMVRDVLEFQGGNILLLGPPGSGKTTIIRDMARVLSGRRRVVVIDTSNEIGGDGNIPHPSIGSARRMQVKNVEEQGYKMIECVQNHSPEVVVIDEIGRQKEVKAAQTVSHRGVRLIASAHGSFQELVANISLCGLVGGVSVVTVGDKMARSRNGRKNVAQRMGKSIFGTIIELNLANIHSWAIFHNVQQKVDSILRGESIEVEERTLDPATGAITRRLCWRRSTVVEDILMQY